MTRPPSSGLFLLESALGIPYHVHTFPTATPQEFEAGSDDTLALSPVSVADFVNEMRNSALRLTDKATASTKTIPLGCDWVWTACYDTLTSSSKGAAIYRASTVGEVADYPATSYFVSANGRYFLLWEYQQHHVEMFGARSDMTYTLTPSVGYVRTAGTDDLTAFNDANSYATVSKVGTFYAIGNNYVNGRLELTATLEGAWFKNFLWVRFTATEQGIYLGANDTYINRINIIGQFDREGIAKPTGHGEIGAIIGCGLSTGAYDHTRIDRFGGDVRVCRAANSGGQVSNGAWMIAVTGKVYSPRFNIGTHGYTNVTSNGLYLQHFGAKIEYTTPPPRPNDIIEYEFEYLETYHPSNGYITFANDFDYALDKFGHVWECASCCDTYFGPSVSTGLGGPFSIGSGDVSNFYAVAEDKPRVGKGIRFGRQVAYEITGMTEWSNYGCFIKGSGESKGTTDVYPGTTVYMNRQIEFDIKGDGIYMTVAAGSVPATAPGKPIYVSRLWGNCDLGDVWVYGSEQCIERQDGTGNLTYNFRGGSGTLQHEFARGGHILGSRVIKQDGDIAGTGSGAFQEGYATNNYCAHVFGDGAHTATLTADAGQFATTLTVTALTEDLCYDDPITLPGGVTVHSRGCSRDGAKTIYCTPIPAALLTGATVSIDRRASLDSFVGNYESSEEGLYLSNATIYSADLSRVRFTGSNAVYVDQNSNLFLHGEMPFCTGLITPITSNYTIRIGSAGRVFCSNMRIPPNTGGVTAHVVCDGDTGNIVFTNCIIGSISTLFDSAMIDKSQGVLVGCTNFSGEFINRFNAIGDQAAQPASGTVLMNKVVAFPHFQLTFKFTAARMTVTDAGVSGSSASLKLFDFNPGVIQPLGYRHNWSAFTEGGALTGGANDAAFVIGFGSVAANAGDGALTGTEVDLGGTASITLPATGLNATATAAAFMTPIDGTATATDLYLNWSGTAATIDANSTIDVTGTYTLNGMFIGDD